MDESLCMHKREIDGTRDPRRALRSLNQATFHKSQRVSWINLVVVIISSGLIEHEVKN